MSNISNVAKKNFIANKNKSFLVIITIILTTALLTSIGILYATFKNANVKELEESIGTFHCVFKIENDAQLQTLKNNTKIEKAGESIYFGMCENKELGINSLSLKYMDKDCAELNNIQLEKGHMPEKINEIVLPKWMIEKLGKKAEIGENLHLKLITATSKEDMWLNKKPNKVEKDFVISGILKENLDSRKFYNSSGLVSQKVVYETLEKKSIDREVNLRFKDIHNIKENIYSVAERIGVTRNEVNLNKFYINELGANLGALVPFIIIGLILIVVAIVVIYNIFYVSIAQKIQSFGLLAAVGSTKKQIRKVIMIDGLYTCIIGIPLGIFLAYGMSYIICYCIMPSFHVGNNFVMKAPLYVIIISALVSLLTVIIALVRPARIASKISPIQAIRFNSYEIVGKKKERKSSGKININKLAYFNLWRNKKRTLMTMFSLTMSGMIFIIVSSVIFSMDINSNLKEVIQNDFLVSSAHVIKDDGKRNPFNDDFIEEVKSIDGITKVEKVNHSYAWFDNSVISNKNAKIASSKECFSFYGFSDEILNKLKEKLVLGKISTENLKNKNEVILVTNSKGRYRFNVGDKVSLKKAKVYRDDKSSEENIDEIYNKEDDNTYKYNEFTVVAIVDKNIEGLDFVKEGAGVFIAHYDTYNRTIEDNRPAQLRIDIEKSKYENVKTSLKNLVGNNEEITIEDYKDIRKDLEGQLRSTKVITYGIVSIIAIIGMLNLINTRVTSIITRKKELGMIEAIGVSKNKLNKMLQIEGFYYSFISCSISIVGGLGIGYLCFKLLKRVATYLTYKVPIKSIVILIAIFLLVQIIITYLVQRILNKESIIDKVRFSE